MTYSYSNTENGQYFVSNAPDNLVWKPIANYQKDYFLSLVSAVRDSIDSSDRNQKGTALENLMTFIYERFNDFAYIHPNVNVGDNQFDHIIEFLDGMVPTFIHNFVGMRIIGESKNHKKSISVREVADLDELLRYKRARLGIFSSVRSFSRGKKGSPWQYAEGKRRKLSLARNRVILGFTLDELETLTENNYYTMIKEKFFNFIDEIDDDFTEDDDIPYHERLYNSLLQLRKNLILDEEPFQIGVKKIIEKYGQLNNMDD
jgi:hypothetical protein